MASWLGHMKADFFGIRRGKSFSYLFADVVNLFPFAFLEEGVDTVGEMRLRAQSYH